jgi:hypothetical protein
MERDPPSDNPFHPQKGNLFEEVGARAMRVRPALGKGEQLLAGVVYVAALVAVMLGLMTALWIGLVFAVACVAVFAFAWATR